MSGKGGKHITEHRKQQAMELLLEGRRICEVALNIGVDERNVYRWLSDPVFKRELGEKRRVILDAVVARIRSATADAVDAIIALLKDDSSNIRLKAANDILLHSAKYVELQDVQERLDEIEKQIAIRSK